MIEQDTRGGGVEYLHLLSLRSKLQLEIRGMKGRYPKTTYSLIKKEYGLHGSRVSVLRQFTDYIEMRKDVNEGRRHKYVPSQRHAGEESLKGYCGCYEPYKSAVHSCMAHEEDQNKTKIECICKEGR